MTDKRLRDDVKGVINAVQLQLDGRQEDAPDYVGLVASSFFHLHVQSSSVITASV